jgi:hypothetical protein
MIYETYTCAMADDSTEYGFCFKAKDGDDDCCTEAEVIVGRVYHKGKTHDEISAEITKGWAKYEWMAKAIVAAPEAQNWEAV